MARGGASGQSWRCGLSVMHSGTLPPRGQPSGWHACNTRRRASQLKAPNGPAVQRGCRLVDVGKARAGRQGRHADAALLDAPLAAHARQLPRAAAGLPRPEAVSRRAPSTVPLHADHSCRERCALAHAPSSTSTAPSLCKLLHRRRAEQRQRQCQTPQRCSTAPHRARAPAALHRRTAHAHLLCRS